MPGSLSQCINLTVEASQIESEGMELDGQGRVQDAIGAYKKAAEGLQRAVDACPSGHADGPVLVQHRKEVLERVAYLEGLDPNQTPSIPLDVHIKGVQLTMAAESSSTGGYGGAAGAATQNGPTGAKTMGATAAMAGAAGLLMIGPIAGLVAAGGAAYATTRSDKIGDGARNVGKAGVAAADKVKALNEEHGITDKAKAVGTAAAEKAKNIDEKYQVREKATQAAVKGVSIAQDFNEKHKVTEKLGTGLAKVGGKIGGLLGGAKPSSSSS